MARSTTQTTSKYYKALAIDPGSTTGLCYGRKLGANAPLEIQPMQIRLTPYELMKLLQQASGTFVICESFEFRQKARAGLDLTPAHLIGVVMACIQEEMLTMQTAAQGKGHFTDAKLKGMGVYMKAHPHAMDATRHLLQWYTFGPGYKYYDEAGVCLAS